METFPTRVIAVDTRARDTLLLTNIQMMEMNAGADALIHEGSEFYCVSSHIE